MTAARYDVVDVFTDQPYAGNPLAVVHGGEHLSSAQMQTIAAEFGLSETTFPLPTTAAGAAGTADYRVRIFTPVSELPFAGHPSIGTAWVLARDGVIAPGDRVQECAAGLLPVHIGTDGARISGGTPKVGDFADADALAASVGLGPDDIDTTAAPRWASAGVPYVFLLVRAGAVARAVPNHQAIQLLTKGPTGLVICTIQPGAKQVHARMFAPGAGTTEDPATGSAAVALGVYPRRPWADPTRRRARVHRLPRHRDRPALNTAHNSHLRRRLRPLHHRRRQRVPHRQRRTTHPPESISTTTPSRPVLPTNRPARLGTPPPPQTPTTTDNRPPQHP